MTVFKTFWNVIKKYKGTIILYTVMLIVFAFLNMSANEDTFDFTNSKPDVYIVNNDCEVGLTKNLIEYMEKSSNIISLENTQEKLNDALFYRDVNYIIYIPKNYRKDVLTLKNPTIDIKSSNDYQASLASMLLKRYINIQNIYLNIADDEDELINYINSNLETKSNIEVTSKINENETTRLATYFNFASYSIMATIIFIICLVMSSFKDKNIDRRTIISSMRYYNFNRWLFIASLVYSIIVFILFTLLAVILFKDIIFNLRGLIYILNSFIFTIVSLGLSLLISTLITNKNAISGIVNVIALGSSFLCGAFVPSEWLPDYVLKIAHILPAYWYINTNDLLKTIEVIDIDSMKPIFINSLVMVIFIVLFIVINNIVTKYKRKFRN